MDIMTLIRRHPLAAFLLWFFTVGQLIAFIPVVGEARGMHLPPHQLFIVAATLIGLLLPALVITRIADGPEGVRRLVRQTMHLRVGFGWYLLALVAIPLGATAIAVLVSGRPEGITAPALRDALVWGLLLQLVLNLVPNNLWEEVAWTGFVQERLQRRHPPVVAAAIAAPLFALQHISLVVGGSIVSSFVLMALLTLLVLPFRFLNAWIFNRTGSLFAVGLAHAAGNAVAGGSGFSAGMLARLYGESSIAGIAHMLAIAVIGLVVLVATRGRLGRAGERSAAGDPKATVAA